MSCVTGSSFGARGAFSNRKPASCGRRLPLRAFTSLPDQTRFSQASLPPRERGTTYVLMGTPAPRSGVKRFSEPLSEQLLRRLPGVDLRNVADRSRRP